jgi:tripartite-type tricarboxylate transporter receptor subunit TctC
MRLTTRFPQLCSVLVMAAGAALFTNASAQDYPSKPIRLVVPFAPGGSTDTIGRALALKLQESFKQPVVVDNRPGAAGAIGSMHVANSPADGYTLLLATTSTHAVLHHLNPNVGYDAKKSFAPIALIAKAPNVLMVSPNLPVKSVADLIRLAKEKPGTLNFASSGTGTVTHLIAERFAADAHIQVVHVPYKTGVQALADIASGDIAYSIDSITWALPQSKAGKVRALAVTSSQRSALAPELPTVAESGLPGFEGMTWFGIVAPAGTPAPVVARLEKQIAEALGTEELKGRLQAQGVEPSYLAPQAFEKFIANENASWGALINKLGIKQ